MSWNLNWSNWSDFAAMGGYGGFVWGSFGVTALVLLIECLALRSRRRAAIGALEETSMQELRNET
jgi:heme exporter protein D